MYSVCVICVQTLEFSLFKHKADYMLFTNLTPHVCETIFFKQTVFNDSENNKLWPFFISVVFKNLYLNCNKQTRVNVKHAS